ncbi:MAG: ABC transporter ATP-binding protein, partial [Gammaproteobacteria bacterium]
FENLRVSSALTAQQPNMHTIHETIKKVGLTHLENTLVNNLSAGQARRVSLARLLLQPAPLWILDEPTTALDAQGQEILMMILNQHLENGGLAVIATHQPFHLQGKEKKLLLGRFA